ncbi:uncharacterized protein [Antedon mediterranea]|uniref:uncharacterized protein n=1 Tax=Antedon mediterranea TaxID=105859 RepID=UPI003AF8968F
MIIYKDRFTEDEMFSDSLKLVEVADGALIEFDSKKVTDTTDMSTVNIGANASAEEAPEDVDDIVEKKDYEIVIYHRVKYEESKPTKAEFKSYIKRHLKKLVDVIKAEEGDAAADKFKAKAQPALMKIIKSYDDYDLYTGEKADFNDETSHCAVLLLNFREDGITPYFTGIKADFIEEKV